MQLCVPIQYVYTLTAHSKWRQQSNTNTNTKEFFSGVCVCELILGVKKLCAFILFINLIANTAHKYTARTHTYTYKFKSALINELN